MKVLVVGFSKTGTKTMNQALQILGYSVYDYEHNFYYLRDEWTKILTKGGTKEDFYRMYKDVDATMDVPVVVFWEELLEAFPDCKLVFMRRKDEEDWIQSWEKQAQSVEDNYALKTLSWFSPTARSIFRYSQHVGRKKLFSFYMNRLKVSFQIHKTGRVVFGSSSTCFYKAYQGISPTVAKKRYRDHNTSVLEVNKPILVLTLKSIDKRRAPKDQMIEFHMKDGWGPLCKFLGKPVPDLPFPHKNKGASLVEDYLRESPVFIRMKTEMKVILTVAVGILGVGAYLFTNNYLKFPEWK